MIIIRYNKSARVVSYRVYIRFMEMYNLSTVQVSDADEHYHSIVDKSYNLIGTIEYRELK